MLIYLTPGTLGTKWQILIQVSKDKKMVKMSSIYEDRLHTQFQSDRNQPVLLERSDPEASTSAASRLGDKTDG